MSNKLLLVRYVLSCREYTLIPNGACLCNFPVCVFFTQLLPSGLYPIRRQLRVAINSAILTDPPPSLGAPITALYISQIDAFDGFDWSD